MKRRDVFISTKIRVIIISTTIVFICLFIFAMLTKTLYTSIVFNNIDSKLLEKKHRVEMFLLRSGDSDNPLGNRKVINIPTQNTPSIIVIMYKGDKLYFMTPNSYFDKNTAPILSRKLGEEIVGISYDGYKFRGVSFKNNHFKIELIINIDSELESVRQLRNSIIIGLLLLVIIALILAYFLSSRIIKPVKEAYNKQVFFVQDASHEMRTPLAIIKGKLELLANALDDTIDTHFEQISKMMSEVRALEKLNTDLLLLSKEDVDYSIHITEFKLKDFIQDINDFYIDIAEIQNKNFKTNNLDQPVIVQWDYNKVRRMIIILLENAFKYTDVNGNIVLTFQDIGKNIKISVKDTGIGIKEEEQNRIFDRFFRSTDIRVRNKGGSGIGLSLLKAISKTLGVKVKLLSKYGEGTEFTVVIPKIIR